MSISRSGSVQSEVTGTCGGRYLTYSVHGVDTPPFVGVFGRSDSTFCVKRNKQMS